MSTPSHRARLVAFAAVVAVALPAAVAGGSAPAAAAATGGNSATTTLRTFTLGATVKATATPAGAAAVTANEVPARVAGPLSHGARSAAGAQAPSAAGVPMGTASPQVSFNGIDHYQQRTADNGNQFSLEPPDQGLCANSSFVFESVNDAVRTFDTSGKPITGVISLSQFYGFPPPINRTTGVYGPLPTDPSCVYDAATGRFFQLMLTLAQDPKTGAFTGYNELTLAVSKTSDPSDAWLIYHLPVMDDGTDGTPNHHCSGNPNGTGHGPCFGDYPHLAVDGNALVMTTNEYSFFGPEFHGAQVYAASKTALAAGRHSVPVVQIDTHSAGPNGQPGFTLWPASSPGTFEKASGGTEYFLSSNAAAETGNTSGYSDDLIVWALSNTSSLNTSDPDVHLSNTLLEINRYIIPSHSQQPPGQLPLMTCLNDASLPTPYGPGCWRYFFSSGGPFNESEQALDSNDTRMQQTAYVNGVLGGALDTALRIDGQNQAAIEAFAVAPSMNGSKVSAHLLISGYYGAKGLNLIYPTLAVTATGRGIMSFSVVGKDMYPSHGYALLNGTSFGGINIDAVGQGPQDGFAGYYAFNAPNPERPRWGDYGAASVVGNKIWFAGEYIGQDCGFKQYLTNTAASPFGTCNDTRTALANWYTRISEVTP